MATFTYRLKPELTKKIYYIETILTLSWIYIFSKNCFKFNLRSEIRNFRDDLKYMAESARANRALLDV